MYLTNAPLAAETGTAVLEIKSRNLSKEAINVECRPRSRLIACEVLRGRLARGVRGHANREKVKHVVRPLCNNTMIITGLLVLICADGIQQN